MASRGINKVILIGNLGQDPEVRYMVNGSAVVNITIATSDNWRDKNTGEMKEKTEWHKVVIFGKLAEIAGEYLKKGSQVYIEGFLQTRKWKDQNNIERYTTEIVVSMNGTMQMLGNRNSGKLHSVSYEENSKKKNDFLKAEKKSKKNVSTKDKENFIKNELKMDLEDEIPF